MNGIKNPKFRTIIRNRDGQNRILTYTAITELGSLIEVNTLGEARLISIIV